MCSFIKSFIIRSNCAAFCGTRPFSALHGQSVCSQADRRKRHAASKLIRTRNKARVWLCSQRGAFLAGRDETIVRSYSGNNFQSCRNTTRICFRTDSWTVMLPSASVAFPLRVEHIVGEDARITYDLYQVELLQPKHVSRILPHLLVSSMNSSMMNNSMRALYCTLRNYSHDLLLYYLMVTNSMIVL